MLVMTEDEARTIMKKYGWSYKERRRRGKGKKYLYAQRWQTPEVYICPLSRLGSLAEPELVAKIAPKPIEEESKVQTDLPSPTEKQK